MQASIEGAGSGMELVGHYQAGRSRHIRVWRHEAGGYWWEMLRGKKSVGGGVGYADTVDLATEVAVEMWTARVYYGVRYKPVVPLRAVGIAEAVLVMLRGEPETGRGRRRRRQHA